MNLWISYSADLNREDSAALRRVIGQGQRGLVREEVRQLLIDRGKKGLEELVAKGRTLLELDTRLGSAGAVSVDSSPELSPFLADLNTPLRMYIALRMLRAWNNGTAGFCSDVVMIVNKWIDDGMKGPIPWPDNPFFAQWAERQGYSKVHGKHVGINLFASLTGAGEPAR